LTRDVVQKRVSDNRAIKLQLAN